MGVYFDVDMAIKISLLNRFSSDDGLI